MGSLAPREGNSRGEARQIRARILILGKLPGDRTCNGERNLALHRVAALDRTAVVLAVWQVVDSKLLERRARLSRSPHARQHGAEPGVDKRVVRAQLGSLCEVLERGGIALDV